MAQETLYKRELGRKEEQRAGDILAGDFNP